MKRVLRLLIFAGLAIVLIAGALAAYVALTFSPKDYLPVLTTAVRESTGRELHSDGSIGLKFFPCCAITLGETALSNPSGFPPGDFARIKSAAFTLRLWPLLTRRDVQIGTVRLDGLAVELRERPDGSTSWDFGAPPADSTRQQATAAKTTGTLAVQGLDIRDASLHYHSEKTGSDYLVENLNLRTGEMSSGRPTQLTADLRLTSVARKLSATMTLTTKITARTAARGEGNSIVLNAPLLQLTATGAGLPGTNLKATFGVRDLTVSRGETLQAVLNDFEGDLELPGSKSPQADLSGSFKIDELRTVPGTLTRLDIPAIHAELHAEGKGIPGQVIDAKFEATKVTADLDQAVASIDALEATIHGLGATVRATGRGRLGGEAGTALAGRLDVQPVSPRSLLAVFNTTPPTTSDPQALTRLAGTANWLWQPAFAGLSALDLQLDQTHISGNLRLPRTEASSLAFDLHVGALDADRYRSADSTAAAAGKPAAKVAASDLPLDTIRALRMDGRLLIDELTWSKLRMRNVSTRVQAADGRLRLEPLSAALYGGTLSGKLSIDASGRDARVALDQRLSALKVGDAMRDIYKSDKLEGDLAATLAVGGTGRTTQDVWRTLAGPVSVHLVNGTYRGADLWYEIRRARALLKRSDLPAAPAQRATPIDSLTLEGKATNGVLHTTQLAGRIPFTELSGDGSFDLADNTLDCRLKAQVVQTPQFPDGGSLPELTGVGIPLTLQGSMASPKVGVDYGNIVKSVITEKVEKKLKEKLFKKFGDLLRE
jgi:AsmA protein